MSTQSSYPGWGPQYNHNAASQNLNYGGDQNLSYGGDQHINHWRDQRINHWGPIGQLVNGEVNSAGRDFVNNFYTLVGNPNRSIWDMISGVGASHKAEQQFERGHCLQGTREELLKAIFEWLSAKGEVPPICWLSGAAGVGKSAIAMTVAEACEKESDLVCSFFFFRSDPKRNNPSALWLTIAYGLASTIPVMQSVIEQRIYGDPMILEASLERQFRDLILSPDPTWNWEGGLWGFIKELSGMVSVPSVVVIDGLDECGDEATQLRILSIIRSAFQEVPHLPLRFLICSRPESWIREAFSDETLHQFTRFIALEDAFSAHRDIERYYLHHFQEIVTSRRYGQVRFPNPWPSKEELEILVERTCGQFVYASTVIKFILLAFSHPMIQLRIILDNGLAGRSGTSPYPQLDALYDLILSANPDLEELLPILAAILVLPHPAKSPACIELVLGLSTGQVALTLRAMHSVLNIKNWGDAIELYHTSFRDYLAEQTRSRSFHIDIPTWTNDIARRWLQNLTTSKIRSYSFDQLHSKEIEPFFTEWIWFCSESISKPSRELLDDLWNVDLAFPYFMTYHEPGINGNEDELGLMNRLTCKFRDLPGRFHLEWPPCVSPSEETLYWVADIVFHLQWAGSVSISQIPRLTDCDCDLSAGNGMGDAWHRAYQEACMQIAKLFVSRFEKHAHSAEDRETLFGLDLDTKLVSLCRTFLELAKECPAVELIPLQEDSARKGLLAWVETFPERLTEEKEEMKARVLALPWAQWTQAYNTR
ncbi:hypothetical protein PQX77_013279 [Marasmius sp. AFHP31]|nr:hypothetical protein PQX77_013279 [Marasmius sp. AFHP31]